MVRILTVTAKEILDSRGTPTIEATLTTERGVGIASVPSGASTGSHEAHELRDGDVARYGGKGVLKAVSNINEKIGERIIGQEYDQSSLDIALCELDGTADKSVLGANAILAVSIAFARAAAQEVGQELYQYIGALDGRTHFKVPQPTFNILNGGKHTKGGIDIQECMLVPVAFATMREKIAVIDTCIATLKALLEDRGFETYFGDEGGFAPKLPGNDLALELLVEAITKAGFTTEQIKIALDVAASSFYMNGAYLLHTEGKEEVVSVANMQEWYVNAVHTYPIVSIEDPFAEESWDDFATLHGALGDSVLIVGDDLLVTNVARIRVAAEKKSVSAAIIKPNQIGSVSEAVQAVQTARAAGMLPWASHRSGETLDTFISDFAVGLSCDYIKAGAPTKLERQIKYNRLIEIEERL